MEKLKKRSTSQPPGRPSNKNSSEEHQRTRRRKRRVPVYWIGLLAFVILNIFIIVLVLNWLYGTLEDYEKHTPSNALNHYFQQLSAGEYEELKAAAPFTPDENSKWDDYFNIIRTRFNAPADELTFRKTAARDLAEGEEVYTVYHGEEKLGEVYLKPDEKSETGWAVYSNASYLDIYTITAPDIVTISMNGAPLPKEGAGVSAPHDILDLLYDQSNIPTLLTYTTEPTLTEPEFTATASTGGACDIAIDKETRAVTITVAPTPEQDAEYRTVLESIAKNYSDFITEDLTFSGLKPSLYPESELYKNLSEYQWGWYLTHENREFLDVEMSDITPLSDTLFTGHIEFTVNVYRGTQIHVEKPSYDMAFIRSEGTWLLAGIKVYHRD